MLAACWKVGGGKNMKRKYRNKKIGYFAGVIIIVAAVSIFWAFQGQGTKAFPQEMYVCENVCKIRAGAGKSFEVVGLLAKEEMVTVLNLVEGEDGQTWYKLDKDSLPADMDIEAEECYIRSDLLSFIS